MKIVINIAEVLNNATLLANMNLLQSGQITFSDVWLEINEALDYPSLVRGVHSTAQRLLPTLVRVTIFILCEI